MRLFNYRAFYNLLVKISAKKEIAKILDLYKIESFKLKSFSLFTVCYHPIMEFTGSALFAGKDRLQISLQILCEFKQIYLFPLKLSENRFCDVLWGNRSHHLNSLNTRSQI